MEQANGAHVQFASLRPLLYCMGIKCTLGVHKNYSKYYIYTVDYTIYCLLVLWYLYVYDIPWYFFPRELRITLSWAQPEWSLSGHSEKLPSRLCSSSNPHFEGMLVWPLTSLLYPTSRSPPCPQRFHGEKLIECFPHEVRYARCTTFPQTAIILK